MLLQLRGSVELALGGRDSVRVLEPVAEGTATLDADCDMPMTILRNPSSSQIRGILRDLPGLARAVTETPGRAVGGPPQLDVLCSRGILDLAPRRR